MSHISQHEACTKDILPQSDDASSPDILALWGIDRWVDGSSPFVGVLWLPHSRGLSLYGWFIINLLIMQTQFKGNKQNWKPRCKSCSRELTLAFFFGFLLTFHIFEVLCQFHSNFLFFYFIENSSNITVDRVIWRLLRFFFFMWNWRMWHMWLKGMCCIF